MFLGRFQERFKKPGSASTPRCTAANQAHCPRRFTTCKLTPLPSSVAFAVSQGTERIRTAISFACVGHRHRAKNPHQAEPGSVQAEFGIAHRACCRSARAVPGASRLGTSPCRRSASSWLRSAST